MPGFGYGGRCMDKAPKEIGGARVVLYTPVDERHKHTGNCLQIVAGELMGAAAGLAICQYEGESSFYLFGCDEEWNSVTDTWHGSDRKSTRLNSSHANISYAVFCLKK